MKMKIIFTVSIIIISCIFINSQQDRSPNHPKKLPAGENAMWDLQLSFNLNDVTGAAGNAGAEFDGSYFYTTRWASNLIHKIDLAGNLVEEFSIPGVSGLRDLAYDGTYMYGGAAANTIYQMDFNTKTLIGTISSPVAVRFIAYDEANDAFWCGTWSDPPTLVNRSGSVLATINTGLSSQYGAAYDPISPAGPSLWIFDQGGGVCPGSMVMYEYNIASGTATGISYDACDDLNDGIAGGLFITTAYVAGTISIGGVMQSNSGLDDTFFVYDLDGCCTCYDHAENPNPANGEEGVSIYISQLTWVNIGDSTVSNELYFGTPGNLNLVQSGSLATSWNITPYPLEYSKLYCWQVVEICASGEPGLPSTWSFRTEDDPSLNHVTDNFYPQSVNYWTGTTDGSTKTDVSEVRGMNLEDGWFMFDISSIPVDATIDSARFYGYVNYTYYPYWSATPLPGLNPLTATASELEDAIVNNNGQGVAYIYSNEQSNFTTGWHNYLMGTTANQDIQNVLGQDWFAIGMDSRDNSSSYYINWDGWAQSHIPYLQITYHYPCCVTFSDNFDSYDAGEQLVCQNPSDWTTWNLNPCDPTTDPYITSDYSWSSNNSVVIIEDNDLVQLFQELTSGKWLISFMLYIPSNQNGYFQVLADFSGESNISGMECYFDQGGGGRLINGDTVNFSWQENQWQIVNVIVDLDNDQAVFQMGTDYTPPTIAVWNWTRGGNIPLKLDAINFYGKLSNNEMFVDNYIFDIYIPVEFTSFSADVSGSSVILNWQTASEMNNRGFEVQRSEVGSHGSEVRWKKIGFVQGNGTTTEPKSYSFTDNNVTTGNYSYRLKQIDFDGSYKYSNVVEVEINKVTEFSLSQNYPNPFNPNTIINYQLPIDNFVTLKVYNTLGEEVAVLVNGMVKAGSHQVTFNADKLSSGVYYYRIESGENVSVKKMVLLR